MVNGKRLTVNSISHPRSHISHRNTSLARPLRQNKKAALFSRSTLSYSEHLGATGWAYALSCWFAILHSYTLGVLHFSFGSAFHTIGLHVFTPFFMQSGSISHPTSQLSIMPVKVLHIAAQPPSIPSNRLQPFPLVWLQFFEPRFCSLRRKRNHVALASGS